MEWIHITKLYPFLNTLDTNTQQDISSSLISKTLPSGTELNTSICSGFSLILSGELQVYKLSETGREVYLYRLFPGDTCFISITCFIANTDDTPIFVRTVTDTHIAFIPPTLFEKYVWNTLAFQQFSLSNLYTKYQQTLELLDAITFTKLDTRLIKYLITNTSTTHPTLYTTQEQLAATLGASREAISRLLNKLKADNIITLKRGCIQVVDYQKLAQTIH